MPISIFFILIRNYHLSVKKAVQRLVLLLLPDGPLVDSLLILPHHMVVTPRTVIVKIHHLWNILHLCMALLEYGQTDCHIIGCHVERPAFILQIFFLYVSEQLGVECS